MSACLLPNNINIRIYGAIILPLLFMGVKLGLTLREEHRLSMSKTRVLWKIFMFRPKREEETGG
jgi:hypothetical protein